MEVNQYFNWTQVKFVFSTMSVLITEIKLGVLEGAGGEQKLTNDLQPTTPPTPHHPHRLEKKKGVEHFEWELMAVCKDFSIYFDWKTLLKSFDVLFSFPLRILQLIMVHVASYLSVVVIINSVCFLIHSIDQRYLKASPPFPIPIPPTQYKNHQW